VTGRYLWYSVLPCYPGSLPSHFGTGSPCVRWCRGPAQSGQRRCFAFFKTGTPT